MGIRETLRESRIPTPVERPEYMDPREIVRRLGALLPEKFLAVRTGAGGAGATILNVPFQPVSIRVINAAGATPAVWDSYFPDGDTARHVVTTTAVAANATPPTITRVGANDYTIGLPTQIAVDAEEVVIELTGWRVDQGSL